MKIVINLTLSLFTLFLMSEASYSLTDYKIKKLCKKERRVLSCIKNLKEKRSDLQKGQFIEIPVIPYER